MEKHFYNMKKTLRKQDKEVIIHILRWLMNGWYMSDWARETYSDLIERLSN